MSYRLEIVYTGRRLVGEYYLVRFLKVLDFRVHFPIFFYFRGQKPKISKNRDRHLVELINLRLKCLPFAFSLKNASFIDPRSLTNCRPKVACSDVTKSAISKKFRLTSKKKFTDVKLLYEKLRRSAMCHVDGAVRFFS